MRDRELGEALASELIDERGGEAIDADAYFTLVDPAPPLYARMPPQRGERRPWLVEIEVEPYRGEQVIEVPVRG